MNIDVSMISSFIKCADIIKLLRLVKGGIEDFQEVQQDEKERIYTAILNSVLTENLRGSRSIHSEKITALVGKTSSLKKIQIFFSVFSIYHLQHSFKLRLYVLDSFYLL